MTTQLRPPIALDTAAQAMAIHRNHLGSAQKNLWQAAMGNYTHSADIRKAPALFEEQMDLDTLIRLAEQSVAPAATAAQLHAPPAAPLETSTADSAPLALDVNRLGANARYATALERAATRTGIPATALAAIVNAEAATDASGQWNNYSRNRRSSAAGLGQFLSRTWEGMAETRGTWLNQTARARGWLDASGQVRATARAQLLQMRYNPTASIETTADYARGNLRHLARAGVTTGNDPVAVARTAYLAHHLGPGDATRYLKTGLSDSRAGLLLRAQIGGGRAQQAIAQNGAASAAHRVWLDNYIGNRVRPERFA